jgi:hypothetical protein
MRALPPPRGDAAAWLARSGAPARAMAPRTPPRRRFADSQRWRHTQHAAPGAARSPAAARRRRTSVILASAAALASAIATASRNSSTYGAQRRGTHAQFFARALFENAPARKRHTIFGAART